jgi:hypothetical protein
MDSATTALVSFSKYTKPQFSTASLLSLAEMVVKKKIINYRYLNQAAMLASTGSHKLPG